MVAVLWLEERHAVVHRPQGATPLPPPSTPSRTTLPGRRHQFDR